MTNHPNRSRRSNPAANAALTPAERQARYRQTGRQIAFVLRDPAALDALDRLTAEHGSLAAAITAALKR